MAAEYDAIAERFRKSRALPFRVHVEEHLVARMLGDPAGLAVLDLACGDGHYARLARRRGASRVVGADLSAEMVALARAEEARDPLGVSYVHAGAEDLGVIGAFDVVTAVYLLHYAPTRGHLEAMCRAIAANLRPGGRLVAMLSHFGPGVPGDTAKYGWGPADSAPIEEGRPYRLAFLAGPDAFEIVNYYHSRPTYEATLLGAGFRSVRWHPPEVSDEGLRTLGRAYWQDFLDIAPIVGLEADF